MANPSEVCSGSDQRSDQTMDQMSDCMKHLDTVSDNWFQFIDNFLDQLLDSKIDPLAECLEQNNQLLDELRTKQTDRLQEVITSFDDNIETETDLTNHSLDLKTCIESLSSQLTDKKSHKTDLTNKTKCLQRDLDQMEDKVRELKVQNKANESNEYVLLASTMRVMYKTWHNSQVIGLLFNDDEEKSLDRLIVMDNEKKSPQSMSQQFWHSINNDYKLK